jgi:hypothetical protein
MLCAGQAESGRAIEIREHEAVWNSFRWLCRFCVRPPSPAELVLVEQCHCVSRPVMGAFMFHEDAEFADPHGTSKFNDESLVLCR